MKKNGFKLKIDHICVNKGQQFGLKIQMEFELPAEKCCEVKQGQHFGAVVTDEQISDDGRSYRRETGFADASET